MNTTWLSVSRRSEFVLVYLIFSVWKMGIILVSYSFQRTSGLKEIDRDCRVFLQEKSSINTGLLWWFSKSMGSTAGHTCIAGLVSVWPISFIKKRDNQQNSLHCPAFAYLHLIIFTPPFTWSCLVINKVNMEKWLMWGMLGFHSECS